MSRRSRLDQCSVLPHFLTEITPNESVSQISAEESSEGTSKEDSSIPSDAVSLISRAEKDELRWKAKRLDALTRELRAIQIGSKAGFSTATIRELLGENLPPPSSEQFASQPLIGPPEDDLASNGVGISVLSFATSAAIPALLTLTLITISLHASSPVSPFPPLRYLHKLLTYGARTTSTATVTYRAAKPMTGLSPNNLSFLVPFLVVGSAVIGWNVLCKELGIEFTGVFGKAGVVTRVFGGEGGFEVDWDAVGEFFGMVEGM